MLKLLFNLRHQSISLTNPGVVVATDSKNYLVAKFNEVSADWDKPLNAIFTHNKDKIAYTVIVGQTEGLEADECYVPWEVLQNSGEVYVSVFCGSLHTTNIVKFNVVKSGYVEGEIPPPPTPTVYEQILETLQNKQDVIYIDNTVDAQYNPDGHYQLYYYDEQGIRHNIFDFSPYLGTDDYNELSNRPTVEGITANGAEVSTTLAGRLKFNTLNFSVATIVNGISLALGKNVFNCNMAANASFPYNFNMISNGFDGAGVYKIKSNRATNKPSFMNSLTGDFYVVHFFMGEDNTSLIRWVIGTDSNDKIVIYIQSATITPVAYSGFSVINQSAWQEIGEKDYNALQNRPVVTGHFGNTGVSTGLEGYINFSPDGFMLSTYQDPDKEIDIELSQNVPVCKTGSNDWVGRYDFNKITNIFASSGVFKVSPEKALNVPTALEGITREVFYVVHLATIADNMSIIRYVIGYDSYVLKAFMQTATLHRNNTFSYDVDSQSDWTEIGAKGDTGATGADGYSPTATVTQTQNGATVSITDKNGTTTANISNGVNGDDYILTAQDKSDIANIVLGLLPTTQGVQYGNQSN